MSMKSISDKNLSHSGKPCLYFAKAGEQNTQAVIDAVAHRMAENNIDKVLVATSTGRSALLAAKVIPPAKIVVITHHTGFEKPDVQTLNEKTRNELSAMGIPIFTGIHAFGGVGRSVRKKLGAYQVDEIIAFTLRTFGQGTKVAVEIALMATDAGLVRTDEYVIAMGGTNSGLDTALVLKPVNANSFLDIKIREIICKPLEF